MRALRGMALAAAALLGSCGGELTEILVVVDSDLAVPSALDGLRVEVSGAEAMSAEGSLRAGANSLPRTVGVVHRGGSLGPLTIRAVGTLGGVEVVSARAITSFVRGRTLVLPLFLSRACAGVSCGADETCRGGSCASAAVDPASLEEWSGSVGRLDGGTPCEPVTERCNGADDDCDGVVDEGFDLATDPLNCGACFNVCSTNNATPSCAAGTCSIASCAAGFADCDGVAGNGCEANLATSTFHCGACDAACSALANATAACADGECGLGACDPGFGDCNADPADGCETSLETTTDCGACGVACAVAGGAGSCAGGTCAVDTCDPGLGDCNADPSDGCEQTLDALDHCGACGAVCALPSATSTCATGSCTVETCDAGSDDCDGDPTNGCEPLDTVTDCGTCGAACVIPSGTGTCATGTCEVDSCDAGRGDCDGDVANGCETNTTNDASHCGTCGNVCSGGMCRMSVCRGA